MICFFGDILLRLTIVLSIHYYIQNPHLPAQANESIKNNETGNNKLSCSYKGAVNNFSKDEEAGNKLMVVFFDTKTNINISVVNVMIIPK